MSCATRYSNVYVHGSSEFNSGTPTVFHALHAGMKTEEILATLGSPMKRSDICIPGLPGAAPLGERYRYALSGTPNSVLVDFDTKNQVTYIFLEKPLNQHSLN